MGKGNKKLWAIILLLLLLILFLCWLLIFGGLAVLQSVGGGSSSSGDQEGDDSSQNQPSDSDCSDYNIGQEFAREFGVSVIFGGKYACESIWGYWVDAKDELSCTFPPQPFDCFDSRVDAAGEFCIGDLEANFLCDANIGYLGCYCKRDEPERCQYICQDAGYEDGEFENNGPDGCKGHIVDYCCCYDSEDEGPQGGSACSETWPGCTGYCAEGQQCVEQYTVFGGQCMCMYPQTSYCNSGLTVPEGTGDAGGWCSEHPCTSGLNCDNYFDKSTMEAKCACTENYFCQDCFEYMVGTCECAPGRDFLMVSKSTFWCVPSGSSC